MQIYTLIANIWVLAWSLIFLVIAIFLIVLGVQTAIEYFKEHR
jgi:hypothetical protein